MIPSHSQNVYSTTCNIPFGLVQPCNHESTSIEHSIDISFVSLGHVTHNTVCAQTRRAVAIKGSRPPPIYVYYAEYSGRSVGWMEGAEWAFRHASVSSNKG